MERKIFTSESVTEGHPDKMCDIISDAILDEFLKGDPLSRVACETAVTAGTIIVMGEITSKANVDIPRTIRDTIRSIGYTRKDEGFSADTNQALEAKINSKEKGDDVILGAGDQGMMFGYATDETKTYMPYPIELAHKLARKLTEVRKNEMLKYLRPDGKTQVSVEYDDENRPFRLEAIVISAQHSSDVSQEQIHSDIKKYVLDPVLPSEMIDENTRIYINPTGRFVIGGPQGDTGLTGRKIIVDTYGGYARHGGGAFSGKDCTKVDRSAAYIARYIAKNIVAARLAKKCEVQLSYAIGVAQPTSIQIDSFGTGKVSDTLLTRLVRETFDLRPAGIITELDLRRPIYKQTAAYGHFGREDIELPWEKTDKIDMLNKALQNITERNKQV